MQNQNTAMGSKFTNIDVMMNRSYREKVLYAETVVEKQVGASSAVACSFGKDSMVVLHLARKFYPAVKVIWNDTGIEYPEVRKFSEEVKRLWDLDLDVLTPEKNFWECVQEYGWPKPRSYSERGVRKGPSVPKCCIYLKERPMHKWMKEHPAFDKIFLGLTAEESRQRRLLFARNGGSSCYFDNSRYHKPILKVNPIWCWRVEDVWRYIRENNLPVCPSYAKYDIPRLGCWPCTSFLNWKQQLQRFSPTVYRRAMHEKEFQYLLTEFNLSPAKLTEPNKELRTNVF